MTNDEGEYEEDKLGVAANVSTTGKRFVLILTQLRLKPTKRGKRSRIKTEKLNAYEKSQSKQQQSRDL